MQKKLVAPKAWLAFTLLFLVPLSFLPRFCWAGTVGPTKAGLPFYFGASYGYGATTWRGLVPTEENQNSAIAMSTPIKVQEGGAAWGLFVGYELIPTFALEANYQRYPRATVFFDKLSLFSFNNNDETELVSNTESLGLMGKIFLLAPHTPLRLYSGAGLASVRRQDLLMNQWRFSPTFGLGLNYRFANHFMAELNGNYTAGFGESQLEPTATFFPFLYSLSVRLAYIF